MRITQGLVNGPAPTWESILPEGVAAEADPWLSGNVVMLDASHETHGNDGVSDAAVSLIKQRANALIEENGGAWRCSYIYRTQKADGAERIVMLIQPCTIQ